MHLPPAIAAWLCAGFIFWLMRRYSRRFEGASFGMWVAIIWTSIVASRPVGYWLSSGTTAANADPMGGSFIDRNTYLFLTILGVIVLAKRRVNWSSILSGSWWLWAFYLFLMLSTIWSANTFVSFKRWFKECGSLVVVLVIISEKDPVEATRGVFMRCAYLLVTVSVLFIKWFPDQGRYFHKWTWETLYCGVTNGKNELGVLAMVSGLFLLWHIVDGLGFPWKGGKFKEAWPDLFILGMCIWILSIARSATSVICFTLGSVIFLGARLTWVRRNLQSLIWCLMGIALVMVAFATLPSFRSIIASMMGRDVTLTGRTDIWEAALKLPTNPVLGNGFAGTWITPLGAAMAEELHIPHAHNGFLETYLNSGVIGLGLLLATLVSGGRNVARHLSEDTAVANIFFAFYLTVLIFNFTEVSFNTLNVLGLVMWLVCAQSAWHARKDKPYEEITIEGLDSEEPLDSTEVTSGHPNVG